MGGDSRSGHFCGCAAGKSPRGLTAVGRIVVFDEVRLLSRQV